MTPKNQITNILKEVSLDLNVPEDIVKLVYHSNWDFIKKTIKELPLKECLSELEFSKLRSSFNIPRIGKLYTNYNMLLKYRYTKKDKKGEDKNGKET